jgi:hypothetical protein
MERQYGHVTVFESCGNHSRPYNPGSYAKQHQQAFSACHCGGSFVQFTESMTMSQLPSCPQCTLESTYPDGGNYVCPDCGFEWPQVAAAAEDETMALVTMRWIARRSRARSCSKPNS